MAIIQKPPVKFAETKEEVLARKEIVPIPPFKAAMRNLDWLNEGNKRLNVGDLSGAESFFRMASSETPDNPLPHYGLGRVHLRTGNYEAAVTEATAVIENPRGRRLLDGDALSSVFYMRAHALAELGRVPEAVQDIKRGKELATSSDVKKAFDAAFADLVKQEGTRQ